MTSPSAPHQHTVPRRVFLSHSTTDSTDAGRLADALLSHGVEVLPRDVTQSASFDAFVVLVTPDSLEDARVENEVGCALAARSQLPELPLLAIARRVGERSVRRLFGTGSYGDASAPAVLPLEEDGPIEAMVPRVLTALRIAPELDAARPAAASIPALAELTIELTRPRMVLHDGMRRPVADARVVYRPALMTAPAVEGAPGEFEAPLGTLEADDLRWYLEEFPQWPYAPRLDRAKQIERALPRWGKLLFDAVLGPSAQTEPLRAWQRVGRAERRITIKVDDRGPPATEIDRHEAAARLLALPWELLHNGAGYLFEGAHAARVRRRLPSTHSMPDLPPSALPLRVLFVLSRPESDTTTFLDPRASLTPLAAVLDTLGHAVELTVLPDGSFQALADALKKAYDANEPYHVVHFDGHGVYDPVKGLGALVFEDEEDARKGALTRKPKRVSADDIGAMLRDHRVPLFVLEACQTAKTDDQPHASVAAALLRAGVASVVAMSHSVLVGTARRFVEAFYGGLVEGQRIGTAMATAQRALKHNRTRRERDDGSRLELDDWLVPVLFQEGDADPPLVPGGADTSAQARRARQIKAERAQGKLPAPPLHTFVGRGRELLAIDRKLLSAPDGGHLLALVGPGGLGKTALIVEAARWLLAIRRVERVAFASVEQVSDARGVIATLGEQLVPGYTIATAESEGREDEKLHNALLPIEKTLWGGPALIVIDNLESVLPAPGSEPSDDVKALFGALVRLAKAGQTRVVLTGRESLPETVTATSRVAALELRIGALGRVEAVELLGAVLRQKGHTPAGEAAKEQVEALIEAVGRHARSLVLLGGEVALRGVAKTVDEVRELMRALEKRHAAKTDEQKRELSVIASVRLSLRRLPEAVQRQIRPLAVLHGPAHYGVIAQVLEIEPDAALELGRQLIAVGLADADGPYLLPDPALAPALAEDFPADERVAAEARWQKAVEGFVGFLYRQHFKDVHVAREGTRTTLVDLLAALERMVEDVEAGARDAAATMGFAIKLESLVSVLGLPRALRRVSAARQALAARLPEWGHARFNAASEELERKLEAGDLSGALKAALALRDQAEAAGDTYPEAAYDRAKSVAQLGRALFRGGAAEQALGLLREAEKRFGPLASAGIKSASLMESALNIEQGDALRALGRLDEAAAHYEKGIRGVDVLGDLRSAAVGRGNLGTVRLKQGRLGDALAAYVQARETFEKLEEPSTVAVLWHQIGMVHQHALQLDAAEAAYRSSLALHVAQGNKAGEASTLGQLGIVYALQARLDEAAVYFRRAVELAHALGAKRHEGSLRAGLGITLHRQKCLDEAREALHAALALIEDCGDSAEPWKTWWSLADVERDAGRPDAAAEAQHQAMVTYRAYRTDGGKPTDPFTRLIAAFGQALRTEGPDAARALISEIEDPPEWLRRIFRALESFAAGNRDPSLAADPALHPLHAVELSLVLESLAAAS